MQSYDAGDFLRIVLLLRIGVCIDDHLEPFLLKVPSHVGFALGDWHGSACTAVGTKTLLTLLNLASSSI